MLEETRKISIKKFKNRRRRRRRRRREREVERLGSELMFRKANKRKKKDIGHGGEKIRDIVG